MVDREHRRIAVINNDPAFLELVEQLLEAEGPYEVFTFRDEETSLGELRAIRPQLIVIDVLADTMPSGWQLALLAAVDSQLGSAPIIITTPKMPTLGRRLDELHEVASVRVVSKPFTSDELRTAVQEALAGAGPADRGSPEPI